MVDEGIVWNAVVNHLPTLIKEIEDLLDSQ